MRLVLAATIVMSLPMSAKTPLPLPDYEAVAKASEICSAKGAFGRNFARSGRVDTTADADWAPFTKLSLGTTDIHAEASFRGTGETLAEDIAQATEFRRALDKALTGKHLFKERTAHSNGVEFHSGEAGAITFSLRQDEDRIIADCIDLDR